MRHYLSLGFVAMFTLCLVGCGGSNDVTVSEPPVNAPTPAEIQAAEMKAKAEQKPYDGTAGSGGNPADHGQ
jgi:hypothetical protein